MRLFIAIEFDPEMKAALTALQDELMQNGIRGNRSKEENLHLTLAFIGEYPDPDDVLEVMSHTAFSPFSISLGKIGTFGDLWWIGIKDCPPLSAYVKNLRHALSDAEIPFDRKRFNPHITLLRKARRVNELPAIRLPHCSASIRRISLMRSDRGRNGMIYTEIGSVACC